MTLSISDFNHNTLLKITTRSKYDIDVRLAHVQFINHNDLGGITYTGYRDQATGLLPTGQGWFDPALIGTKPYGIVKVEIITITRFISKHIINVIKSS